MLGLKQKEVRLLPHCVEWEADARSAIFALKEIFGEKAPGIEHVGSTSVAGLPAKPIVDLAVGVRRFEDVWPLVARLEENGFFHVPQNDDETQIFFSCRGEEADVRTRHIHVVLLEGKEWRDYLYFRDALRRDSNLRAQYAQLKKELGERFPKDRNAYTEGKAAWIQSVLNENLL